LTTLREKEAEKANRRRLMNRRPMNRPMNQKGGGWFWRAKVSLLYFY